MMTYKSIFLLALATITLCQVAHAQSYVAEGYFVVDNKVVENYISQFAGTGSYSTRRTTALATLREDINYILTEINERVSSISSQGSISVEVRLRALQILERDVFPSTTLQNGQVITSGTALSQFEDWLKSQSAFSKLGYDFAILWTGYDLYGSSGGYTAGFAHVGTICDSEKSTGVVEFNATYSTAETTAHELGHILGSSHGGAVSEYIMAAVNDPEHSKRWFFSECSVGDIRDNIATLGSNCLLSTNSASTKPSTTLASYKGQLLDPNVSCQRRMNNSNSYMCMATSLYGDQVPKGDLICQQIYCRIIGSSFCTSSVPPEGLICDVNKRCREGRCVLDTTFPAKIADASCVLGDQRELEISSLGFKGTCSQFIASHGSHNCYNEYINSLCCQTCNKFKTNLDTCLYGDKSTDCVNYPQASICPRYKSDLCCGYCRNFVSKRSIREDKDISIELFENVIIPSEDMEKDIKVQYQIPNDQEED